MPKCHLLVCGAPCQPFSRAHRPPENAKGLDDPRSLFRETLDIIDLFKKKNPGLQWMIENVEFGTTKDTPHLRAHRTEIDNRAQELGGHTTLHQLKWFQPTTRVRCLWSNLEWDPYKHDGATPQWADILHNAEPPKDHRGHPRRWAPAVMASANSHSDRAGLSMVTRPDGSKRAMSFHELEAVQGLPQNSTRVEKISARDRKKIIGNAFSAVWVAWLIRNALLNSCTTATKNTTKARIEATKRSEPTQDQPGSGGRVARKREKLNASREEPPEEPEFKIVWEEAGAPPDEGIGGPRSPETNEKLRKVFTSTPKSHRQMQINAEAKELLEFRSKTKSRLVFDHRKEPPYKYIEVPVRSPQTQADRPESSSQGAERAEEEPGPVRFRATQGPRRKQSRPQRTQGKEPSESPTKAPGTAPRRYDPPPGAQGRKKHVGPGARAPAGEKAYDSVGTPEGLEPLSGPAWETEVKTAAIEDESYQKIVGALQKEPIDRDRTLQEARGFSLRDGLLWKVESDRTVVYLPDSRELIHRFLWHMHDAPGHGSHSGYLRTLANTCRYAWWPTRSRDIYLYTTSCEHCIRFNDSSFRLAAHLEMIAPTAGPGHTLTMDFMGPFPVTSPQGNCQALIVQDKFTKLTVAVPLGRQFQWKSANRIVAKPSPKKGQVHADDWKKFEKHEDKQPKTVWVEEYIPGLLEVLRDQVFSRYGYPRIIIADRDPKFSGDFQDYIKAHGVQYNPTAPHNPRANGGSERFMKSAAKAIGEGFAGKKNDWESRLLLFVQAYNATTHASTGFPPDVLHYGRPLPTYIENVLDTMKRPGTFRELEPKRLTASYRKYNEQQLNDQVQNWREALDSLHKANEKEEKRASKKQLQKPPTYEVGDLVLVRPYHHHQKTKHKGAPQWVGPLAVCKTPRSPAGNQHNVVVRRDRSKEHVLHPFTEKVAHGRDFTDDRTDTRNIKDVKPYKANDSRLFPVQELRPTPVGLRPTSDDEESEEEPSQRTASSAEVTESENEEVDIQQRFKGEGDAEPVRFNNSRVKDILESWRAPRVNPAHGIRPSPWWEKATQEPLAREPVKIRKDVSAHDLRMIERLPWRDQRKAIQYLPSYLRPGFVPSYLGKRSPEQRRAYDYLPSAVRKGLQRLDKGDVKGPERKQLHRDLHDREDVKFVYGLGSPIKPEDWKDPYRACFSELATPEWARQHAKLVREQELRKAQGGEWKAVWANGCQVQINPATGRPDYQSGSAKVRKAGVRWKFFPKPERGKKDRMTRPCSKRVWSDTNQQKNRHEAKEARVPREKAAATRTEGVGAGVLEDVARLLNEKLERQVLQEMRKRLESGACQSLTDRTATPSRGSTWFPCTPIITSKETSDDGGIPEIN